MLHFMIARRHHATSNSGSAPDRGSALTPFPTPPGQREDCWRTTTTSIGSSWSSAGWHPRAAGPQGPSLDGKGTFTNGRHHQAKAIIVGLLVGLTAYFYRQATTSGPCIVHEAALWGWPALTHAFGLIITVQGFETSRYLGHDYEPLPTRAGRCGWRRSCPPSSNDLHRLGSSPSPARSRAVRIERDGDHRHDGPDHPDPAAAAGRGGRCAAQFSAAIADTSGSGGLVEELTRGRIMPPMR